MDAICPTAIESLVRIWSALHRDLDIELDPADTRYLHGVLLGMDDELVARLLAAKLSMSRPPDLHGGGDLARRGSRVAYTVQGRSLDAILVHGSTVAEDRLGVGTRFGAALLGMRPGQSVLWPIECGQLVDVRILNVVTRRSGMRRRAGAPASVMGKPCAFG